LCDRRAAIASQDFRLAFLVARIIHPNSSVAALLFLLIQSSKAKDIAYVDTVHILVVTTAYLIPIGYLMKKPRFRTKPVEPME